MAKITTNWDQVRQSMTDDVSSQLNGVSRNAITDIEKRLKEKGVPSNKISKSKSKITYITDNSQEFSNVEVYFGEVYDDISNNSNWPDTL